jgi:3-dehydroquinate dehydratase type II
VPDGHGGFLVVREPWPAMLRGIWGDPERFKETYWSRFETMYFAGDGAKKDEDGDVWLLGRVDDVMNISGHRLSTAEIESALVSHPAVAEAAVVGAADETTGQAVVAFVILRGDAVDSGEETVQDLRNHVGKEIGPIAKPKTILVVPELPKTRSGKIMRRLLKDVAEGREVGDATTLADNTVMAQVVGAAVVVWSAGYQAGCAAAAAQLPAANIVPVTNSAGGLWRDRFAGMTEATPANAAGRGTILVLNGPNLNLLGTREPEKYGTATLADVEQLAKEAGAAHGLDVECFQSNHEGALVDAIHAARGKAVGIVLNAGAYTHTSVAIRDAISAVALPTVEVHITNVHARESFRHHSYLSDISKAVIAGAGILGYRFAVEYLAGLHADED